MLLLGVSLGTSQKGVLYEGSAYKINRVDFLEQLCCCILIFDCLHIFSGGFMLNKLITVTALGVITICSIRHTSLSDERYVSYNIKYILFSKYL